MEISQYDEYIPEKELDMNFRIPRKRTAQESFGLAPSYGEQTSTYTANAPKMPAYGRTISGSNYPNLGNDMSCEKSPQFNTSVRPPVIPPKQNRSYGNEQLYSRRNIEYPLASMNPPNPNFSWNQEGSKTANSGFGSHQTNRNSSLVENESAGWKDYNRKPDFQQQNVTKGGGFIEKPLGWNNQNSAGFNSGNTSRGGFNRGNSSLGGFNSSRGGFNTGNSSRGGFNSGNNSSGGFKSGNSSGGGFNSGNNSGGGFNSGNNSGGGFNSSYSSGGDFDSLSGGFDSGNGSSGGFNRGNSMSDGFNSGNSFRGQKVGRFNGNYNSGQSQRGFRNGSMNTQRNFAEGPTSNKDGAWKPGPNKNGRSWNKLEKPKIPKTGMRPVTIPDASDQSLPKELREMFQPLICKLCSLEMTSNVMAKMHYVSKNHEKKIRKYLIEHSEKTGEPLHPRATITNAARKEKEEDKDPRNFYCDICDLKLTGKQHADSHYMGKSHNAVRMGLKRPAGKGNFDQEGKWVRKTTDTKAPEDPFGMDFRKKPEEADASIVEDVKPKSSSVIQEQFACSLCSVSCISQDQLNIHFSGSKHKKKLKLNGISPENFTPPKENEPKTTTENMTTDLATVSKETSELKAKYMTPNGYFYCEKCNLTVNSEMQFKQHLASKNHAKKVKN